MSDTITLEKLSKYKSAELRPEDAIFIQQFIQQCIETRTGSVKASESQQLGTIYNRLTSYIQCYHCARPYLCTTSHRKASH